MSSPSFARQSLPTAPMRLASGTPVSYPMMPFSSLMVSTTALIFFSLAKRTRVLSRLAYRQAGSVMWNAWIGSATTGVESNLTTAFVSDPSGAVAITVASLDPKGTYA
ncbi:unannotated protein [freshwater metagenome]|uniref:Unannotated protein n=1 Tax=freshwater metagenome TaxID=449393 RepID=A0A6J7A680_9ZZZZ